MTDYLFSSFASTSYSPLLSKEDQVFDGRPHVLVADHGLSYRRYVENVFVNFGCKVTSVDNGQKALEFLGLGDAQCTNSGVSTGMNFKFFSSTESIQPMLAFFISQLGKNYLQILLQCSNVKLIITEYDMPRITGYELLKKLKESPKLKEIPVVIVSSEDLKSRIEMCGEAGAQEFLLKPLKLVDLEKLRYYIM